MRAIETNDSGKTDIKDSHVIHTLASIGKTVIYRRYDEPYSLLLEWNGIYEEADVAVVRSKRWLQRWRPVLEHPIPIYKWMTALIG
jgi:hypothetical protein